MCNREVGVAWGRECYLWPSRSPWSDYPTVMASRETLVNGSDVVLSSIHEATLADGGPENYKKWAPSYEFDLQLTVYNGPESANSKWLNYHSQHLQPGSNKHRVLDAGCGTGLVGKNLVSSVQPGCIELYGGDLSPDMLEVARTKQIYSDLQVINLKEQLPYDVESFDSIVCVGVFIQGHCGPSCLPNLMRVLKKGCLLIATIRKIFFENTKRAWENNIRECNCTVEEQVDMPYLDDMECIVVVIRKM